MSLNELIIKGARQNNLRNISLTLPHNRVIAVTGVSGSGKSSLAFDTIFAEGQRRFIESLSPYARLFLEKLDRPEVELIRNIRPSIALEQHNPVKGSRSTVGTATEIYDYLRLLYARIGHPHCSECGKQLQAWSPSSAVKELVSTYAGEKALIIFDSDDSPEDLARRGFHRIREVGRGISRSGPASRAGRMEVIVDRLLIRDEPRLSDSIELAWENGGGDMRVEVLAGEDHQEGERLTLRFSSQIRCPDCGIDIQRPQPLLFSFNHPLGACPDCRGFGNTLEYSEDCIVPDDSRSLEEGAIEPWSRPAYRKWHRRFIRQARSKGIRTDLPYRELPRETRRLIFSGDDEFYGLNDFFGKLETKKYKLHVRVFLSRYRKAVICKSCSGSRLNPVALGFSVGGRTISGLTEMPVSELKEFFSGLRLSDYESGVADEILRQVNLKLGFLMRVGLDYLSLNRQSRSLSGGESQRINLSNQLASRLTGTLYVLDEPTVGLHQRDVGRIAEVLGELALMGNTVIAVEHDRSVIETADWIVELGPGGGEQGGELIFSGWRPDILKTDTLTAKYLKNSDSIQVPSQRRRGSGRRLSITGARGNNLKNIDVDIPFGTLACVTGVSGSGKSTLVEETIYNIIAKAFHISYDVPLPYDSIRGLEHLKGVRIIDQQPIGKSPRSNPVTYIKAFDAIRKLFSGLPQSRNLGYGAGHFSFNTESGRCGECRGAGYQKLEMFFFEDLYIKCDTCRGQRYRPEILNVIYNGKNVFEVLNLTVDEAVGFFRKEPSILPKLRLMSSVGLGYLRLGQPATTLSGGEAQRLKVCAELGASDRKEFLYLLDEPTVGLHPDDIRKLLKVLNDLVNAGNTVLLVEHNLDVIKSCDWLIDLGPEGGDNGGYLVAEGTPEEIIHEEKSLTGYYLREYLK
jgi:excinuclease ABC subunit A